MNSRRFTEEEKRWLLYNFIKNGYNFVKNNWQLNFSTEVPSLRTLYRYQKKIKEKGTLQDEKRTGRPRTAQTEENSIIVCQSVIEQNPTSTRRISKQHNISQSSVFRILKSNNLRPFIPRKVHQLFLPDNELRLEFCNIILTLCDQNPNLMNNIIWSDEAIFKLSRTENRSNTIYWSDTNPHITSVQQLNQPGLMTWAAVSSRGIIGPYFYENNVTGQTYLRMLNEFVFPQVDQLPNNNELYFMHDGAPAHFDRRVRQLLISRFGERFIGRGAPIQYPPRSPDLTPLDFSIWGIIKDKVYSRNPSSLTELRQCIVEEFDILNGNLDLLIKIVNSVFDRLWFCIVAEGFQFEHLL